MTWANLLIIHNSASMLRKLSLNLLVILQCSVAMQCVAGEVQYSNVFMIFTLVGGMVIPISDSREARR